MASVSQTPLMKYFLIFCTFFIITAEGHAMFSSPVSSTLPFASSPLLNMGNIRLIPFMDEIRGPYRVNMHYEYDDADINNLLLLRAQEVGLDLTRTVLIPPLDNMGDQIAEQLREERVRYRERVLAREIEPIARVILVPVNLNDIHWVGLVIRLDERNQVLQIQYIDPLGSSILVEDAIPEEIRRALRVAYGRNIYIENLVLLRQTDGAACGTLTVENLVRAAQEQMDTEVAHIELTRGIRDHHIYLLEQFRPELQFNFRQENNISDWSKKKLLKLSLMSQFRDLELNTTPDTPEFLLPIFLKTVEKFVSTQKKALDLIANPVFQQIMAIHTSSSEVERLKIEFLARIENIAHKKVEREEGSEKEYSDTALNDFVNLFVTGLKCLCISRSIVVSEGKYILRFKKLLSHSVIKTPYLTHSLVIEFNIPEKEDPLFDIHENKEPLMFACELTKLLLRLSMTDNEQLRLIPTPILNFAEKKVVRVRYDISILPTPGFISAEKVWSGDVDFSITLRDRLEKMIFETNQIRPFKIPLRLLRDNSQIKGKNPYNHLFRYDERFPSYNANFIYERGDVHVALGEGPETNESFVRLLHDLTSLYSTFPDNKKIIVALGNFYPRKDFLPYYEMNQTYFDKKQTYQVTTTPIIDIISPNISGYWLSINGGQRFLVLNVRMSETEILNLDEQDLQLLYDRVYSQDKVFVLFHCKWGVARSASFATLMKLFKEWEYLFQDKFEYVGGISTGRIKGINESDFVNRIQQAYWEIKLKRDICPTFYLFEQIFQILLKFRKMHVASL